MSTIIQRPSPNHAPRKEGVRVDTILLHHTGGAKDAGALHWLTLPKGAKYNVRERQPDGSHKLVTVTHKSPVSAHYVVGVEGTVWQLVDEGRKAFDAGLGRLPWETCKPYDFGHRSIGIELVNPGDGKTPFTEAQYVSLAWLLPAIAGRLTVGGGYASVRPLVAPPLSAYAGVYRVNVLGHRDTSPGRKFDPADNFDWGRVRAALDSRQAQRQRHPTGCGGA